jgi:hypothetical protein
MLVKIEAKKSLYINEWQMTIVNDCNYNIVVDLGHTELMVRAITIKEETEIPPPFREG